MKTATALRSLLAAVRRLCSSGYGFMFTPLLMAGLLSGMATEPLQGQISYMRYYEQQGDDAAAMGFYREAWRSYKTALRFQVRNDTLLFKCAEAARRYNSYDEAEFLYLKLLGYNADTLFPIIWLRLGEMSLYNDNPSEGKTYLETFLSLPHVSVDDRLRASFLHESCQWSLRHAKDSIGVSVMHLNEQVNSPNSESSGVLLADSLLYFSSSRPFSKTSVTEVIPTAPIAHIYHARKKDSVSYAKAEVVKGKINTDYAHSTHLAFDKRGRRFFLTRSSLNHPNYYHIYYSESKHNLPSKPKKLKGDIHLKGYCSMHPTVAYDHDQTLIFFSSDRPGGLGGFDIWYVLFDGKTTSQPINLGYPINTSADEITPFYDQDSHSLYFSSNGHLGYGNFDIFVSKGRRNAWTKPQNLLKPINTPANDLYYSLGCNGRQAILTSNRKGSYFEDNQTCCNDLYAVSISPPLSPDTIIMSPFTPSATDHQQQISSLLPLSLYFDNDLPHKDRFDSIALEPFGDLSSHYKHAKNRFSAAFAQGLSGEKEDSARHRISLFFDSVVIPSNSKVEQMMQWLYEDLQSGKRIALSVKGFASPLHTPIYNLKLSQRRINSFIKELSQWQGGVLQPYLLATDSTAAHLTIIELAFGSDRAAEKSNHKTTDVRHSIYSPEASKERRIEIQRCEYLP